MKKALAIVLTLAVLACSCCMSAFAASVKSDPITIVCDDAGYGMSGDTKSAGVSFSANTGFAAFNLKLTYDNTKIKVNSVTSDLASGTFRTSVINASSTYVIIGFMSDNGLDITATDVDLFTVNFEILSGASDGINSIAIRIVDICDEDFNVPTVTTAPVSVYVCSAVYAAARSAINAIGTINRDNYVSKNATEIAAANTALQNLRTATGDDTIVTDNNQTLVNAVSTYNNFVAEVGEVDSAIDSLPNASDIADLSREFMIELVRDQIAELSTTQKGQLENSAAFDAIWAKVISLYILGDVNGNFSVTSTDALMALQHSVSKITLTGGRITRALVDNTEGVTATDALEILKYSVEIIDLFPVEE